MSHEDFNLLWKNLRINAKHFENNKDHAINWYRIGENGYDNKIYNNKNYSFMYEHVKWAEDNCVGNFYRMRDSDTVVNDVLIFIDEYFPKIDTTVLSRDDIFDDINNTPVLSSEERAELIDSLMFVVMEKDMNIMTFSDANDAIMFRFFISNWFDD